MNQSKSGVPLYLEDKTVIGRVSVEDGKHLSIEFDDSYPLVELLSENLIGFSVVTMAADRAEDILNKEKGEPNV